MLAVTSGCAPKRSDILHFLRAKEHKVSAIEYRVGIPDTITISAPRVLEIDGESQGIQPDGKISLRLLGDVKIVDMTAKEIGAKLEVLLSRYYRDPKVRVRIGSYNSKQYYVHTQSGRIRVRPYTGYDTLLDAVVASGADFRSWKSKVRVVRPSYDASPVREIVVNVDHMLKTGDWSRNVLLEPDDVVVIPPTIGSWIGQRVRELFYPVSPIVQAYVAPASLLNIDQAYSQNGGSQFNSGAGGFGGLGGGGGFGGGGFNNGGY